MERIDHIKEATALITDCLDGYTPPVVDEAWELKLQALKDFTALAWYNVGQDRLTASEAENAIDDFVIWLES